MATALRQDERPGAGVTEPVTRDPVVVVGAGPSGLRAAQEVSRRGLPVILFNAERWKPYNRVKLTPFLAGEVQIRVVYQADVFPAGASVTQYNGHKIVSIDREAKEVENQFGRRWRYDKLILCLGSRAHIPAIPGGDLPGVFSFRDFDDVERLKARTIRSRRAVVIGGGLLGLEAARGMSLRGNATTVIEFENRLMARQLDLGAGTTLAERIVAMGIDVRTGESVKAILGAERVEGVALASGAELPCDTVVICTGIRSNIELARSAGIVVGRGITVDDAMRTSDPDVYAVGECAEHDGNVYGLVAPGLEQAAVAAAQVAGEAASYRGSVPTTKLKVVGADVFSMGEVEQIDTRPDLTTALWQDPDSGCYRRLVFRRFRLVGALGVGPWPEVGRIQQAVRDRTIVFPWQRWRFLRSGDLFGEAQAPSVLAWPPAATVCNCTGVTRGQLGHAVARGVATVEALCRETSASTVCGTCRPLLAALVGAKPEFAPVPGRRAIAISSALAVLVGLAAWLGPAWPFSTSVEAGIGIDRFWIDGLWKQVSGFTLVGLAALVLVLSLRKRINLTWLGAFAKWRVVHSLVGAAMLAALFMHTGFNLGANLNRWLMLTFLAVIAAGSLTGLATAGEKALAARGIKPRRELLLWIHILTFWPFPLLLALHVVTVYAY